MRVEVKSAFKLLQAHSAAMRSGVLLAGGADGLFAFEDKEPSLLLGGGRVLALATDEKGDIYAASSIPQFNIFKLDQKCRPVPVVPQANLTSFGLAVAAGRIYFTAYQDYKVVVKQFAAGKVSTVLEGGGYRSLLVEKDQMYIGQVDRISVVRGGEKRTLVTEVEGKGLSWVCGLIRHKGYVVGSDRGHKRLIAVDQQGKGITVGGSDGIAATGLCRSTEGAVVLCLTKQNSLLQANLG